MDDEPMPGEEDDASKTDKSSDIDKIVFASGDNLEKKPKYLNTRNENEDTVVNQKFNSQSNSEVLITCNPP